ncbi:MAG: NADH-dependent [FeFe] hydrogenase, group A6 [Bacillota bacterium]
MTTANPATVKLTIDGRPVEAPAGSTILQAARAAGIHIPTLCYLENINSIGACRLCLVQVTGMAGLVTSCVQPVQEGMVVTTQGPALRDARRTVIELLLSDHHVECPTCLRSGSCELEALAHQLGVHEVPYTGEKRAWKRDASTPSLVWDPSKCVLCRRCVSTCEKVQTVSAIGLIERNFRARVGAPYDRDLIESTCTLCGQCSKACPTGAITERDETDAVWRALYDPHRHVVVQTAPAVRVALGEIFGLPPGAVTPGQMVAALRRLGFDRVFDTNFTADLTILEEASELVERVKSGGPLPLITSCSPGWIKFIEHFYPSLLEHVSSCKSPQQMFGAVAKTYYAQRAGVDPATMTVVSIMPCTAKKFEASRPEMNASGFRDVDIVLTTRELGRMLKQAGINPAELPAEDYDDPLGKSTGAAVIFGATGGVMEAALRTAYEWVTGQELKQVNFTDVRGLDGVKEAEVAVGDLHLKVAVAHSLGHARQVMDRLMEARAKRQPMPYQFIEIMGCPGGCIGGGGQPISRDPDILRKRMDAVYDLDERAVIRKSHENPAVQELYREFLGKPLSHRSHELLHTHYTARGTTIRGILAALGRDAEGERTG